MIFIAGRSVARLRAQCLGGRRTLLSSTTEHAPLLQKLFSSSDSLSLLAKPNLLTPILRRFYADQPVSRPKAHTGRATRKTSGTTTKKPASKTSTSARKTKSKAKPKSKSKAKPRKKVKAKAKAKPKRKVLTEKQKAVKTKRDRLDKIKNLKKRALLDGPSASAISAYQAFFIENFPSKNKGTPAVDHVKELARKWKNVTTEQLEHFNHVANQKTAARKAASATWVESHTPDEILDANNARRQLTRLRKVDNPKSPAYHLIKDDRQVRRSKSSYAYFFMNRHKSGDFKGMKAVEAAPLAAREWKALSAAEKKPFEDAAAGDKIRYEAEKKTVYKK